MGYVYRLVLGVQRSVDVAKIKEFFNGGEYGCYRVSRILDNVIDAVFSIKDLLGNQLTVDVLEVSQHVHDGVVDIIGCVAADIHKVRFLDRGKFLLHKRLLHSRNLSEYTHSLGVCDLHVGIRVSGCDVRDDERTLASWLDEGSG